MTALTTRRKTITVRAYREPLGNIPLEMTFIPAGSFWMGTPNEEIERLCKEYGVDYFRRESPQHLVTVSQFYLGRYPITQAQWKVVADWEKEELDLKSEPSHFKDDFEGKVNGEIRRFDAGQRPVERVSWLEAKEFCARLSKRAGKLYRLPTEAEWEYACRAVNSYQSSVTSEQLSQLSKEEERALIQEWNEKYHQPFHFGEIIAADHANYRATKVYGRGVTGEYREQTTPVGFFRGANQVANNFGLSDMHGNVLEWCEDDRHDNYEGAPTDGTTWVNLKDKSASKVLRGGSWNFNPRYCRSANRSNNSRAHGNINIGFRVVCSLPGSP